MKLFGKALGTKLAKVCDENVEHSLKDTIYIEPLANRGSYRVLKVKGPQLLAGGPFWLALSMERCSCEITMII